MHAAHSTCLDVDIQFQHCVKMTSLSSRLVFTARKWVHTCFDTTLFLVEYSRWGKVGSCSTIFRCLLENFKKKEEEKSVLFSVSITAIQERQMYWIKGLCLLGQGKLFLNMWNLKLIGKPTNIAFLNSRRQARAFKKRTDTKPPKWLKTLTLLSLAC